MVKCSVLAKHPICGAKSLESYLKTCEISNLVLSCFGIQIKAIAWSKAPLNHLYTKAKCIAKIFLRKVLFPLMHYSTSPTSRLPAS